MGDINSTTPLGTETTPGATTNGSDAAATVLSFWAVKNDGFYISIPAGAVGYWRPGYRSDWLPIPAAGLNATLTCNIIGPFTLQVKRVPGGSDVTDVRAGRLFLGKD
jgi:hypothetical protein